MAPKYTFSETGADMASKAIKLAHRGATPLRPVGCLRGLSDATHAPVSSSVRLAFDTASWAWDNGHVVVLGDAFADHIRMRPSRVRTPEGMTRHAMAYAAQLLRHETGHGLHTDRDLRGIAVRARALGVPFVLVNVFEDARIEHLLRASQGASFDWWRWNDLRDAQTPLDAFAYCIARERESASRWNENKAPAERHRMNAVVYDFYRRACAAPSTDAIVTLCREWLETWHTQQVANAGTATAGHYNGRTDDIGSEVDGSAPAAPAAPAPASEAADLPQGVNGVSLGTGQHAADLPKSVRTTWRSYRAFSTAKPLNAQAAQRVAHRVGRIIAETASTTQAQVTTSGSRLHMAGIVAQSERAFRTASFRGGVPTVCLAMDMSASMMEDYPAHAQSFLGALRILHTQGAIVLDAWLTGGGAHAPLPADVSSADFDSIAPNKQGEAISATLRAITANVQAATVTLIYTDAALVDGHVDAGAWRRKGVELLGACVIPAGVSQSRREKMQGEMTQHFGRSVVGQTGDELAGKIAQYVGQRMT